MFPPASRGASFAGDRPGMLAPQEMAWGGGVPMGSPCGPHQSASQGPSALRGQGAGQMFPRSTSEMVTTGYGGGGSALLASGGSYSYTPHGHSLLETGASQAFQSPHACPASQSFGGLAASPLQHA